VARGYPDYRYFSFPVSASEGGTGVGTLTLYGVLLGNASSPVQVSAAGSPYEVLRVPAPGGFPAFGAVDLAQAAAVTGLLPVAKGGTGTADGSITGTGGLTFRAGGVDQSITFYPSGAGLVFFDDTAYMQPDGSYVSGSGLFRSINGPVTLQAWGANQDVNLAPSGNGKVTTAAQLVSTLATGTAPLVIASTTVVSNLNAERVAGTQVTNAAATGALLIGSGAGTAAWGTPDGARVYNSANETITDALLTLLTYDSERYDNGGLHSTVTNTERLTAVKAGKYSISACVQWAYNSTGTRGLYVQSSAAGLIVGDHRPTSAAGNPIQNVSTIFHLAAGDWVQVLVYQSSGGNLPVIVDGSFSPEFAMQWLGP